MSGVKLIWSTPDAETLVAYMARVSNPENQNNKETLRNKMDLDSYQTEAMSYRIDSANEAYALFNLAAEVGEVLGLVAKLIRDGAGEKNMEEMMKKELGDVMWMVCAVADDAGLSLSEICTENLAKLADRKARNKIMGSGDER